MVTKHKTILAVDDDLDILRVVDKILKAAGYNVVCVQSPKAAHDYLAVDIPHLILSTSFK
jgi:PleD family two-component response regulator